MERFEVELNARRYARYMRVSTKEMAKALVVVIRRLQLDTLNTLEDGNKVN